MSELRQSDEKAHTRTSTDAGPDFCLECSAAANNWITWPCRASRICFFCGVQCDPFCGDWANREPTTPPAQPTPSPDDLPCVAGEGGGGL